MYDPIPTPGSADTTAVTTPEMKIKQPVAKHEVVLVLLVAVIFTVLGAVAMYLYDHILQLSGGQNPTPTVTNNFSGRYLIGNVPPGWKINEITDNAVGIIASGLSGFEVIKTTAGTDNAIFTVSYAGGYGGAGYCSNIYKFADTSAQYITSRTSTNTEPNTAPPTSKVIDLTKEQYLTVDLFGVNTRLVYSNPAVNGLYLNALDNPTVNGSYITNATAKDTQEFDPQCDDDASSVASFPGLSFTTPETGYPNSNLNNYSAVLNNTNLNPTDAGILAGILNSLKQK